MSMTNEEAILQILEHNMIHQAKEPQAVRITEALNMAIKALEQEPCDDCVSRQAVMQTLYDYGCESKTQDAIAELPPVTPERPKGEWKSDGHGHIFCTACNQTNVSLWKSDFCPICGSYNGQTRKE